jgi:hypothetical protein
MEVCYLSAEILLDDGISVLIPRRISDIEWAENTRVGSVILLEHLLCLSIDESSITVRLKSTGLED